MSNDNIAKNDIKSKVVISPIDVDEYQDFLSAAHHETFRITFGREIPDEFLKKEFLRTKADAATDRSSVVGAFLDKNIVGHAVLEIRTHADNLRYGWIHFYYVSPECRKEGVGSELVRYSKEYFSALGLKEFTLRTGEQNKGAQEFYLKVGFVQIPKEDIISLYGVKELHMLYTI